METKSKSAGQTEITNIKDRESNPGIPVTIITGFLGSGKTTLLNHILTNQIDLKTGVLVNEFGEIGIDNDLIVSTSEDMVELTNGCICCTINGELVDTVQKILTNNDSIEYLIVETTGLADPLPVAMSFLSSELREKVRLDSIITMIDAENFEATLLESEVGRSQLIYGDIILINKCDLVKKEYINEIEDKINDIKTEPRILNTVNGIAPLSLILSVGLFQTDLIAQEESTHNSHKHNHSECDHSENKSIHDKAGGHKVYKKITSSNNHEGIEGFTSISFESNGPFSLRKFQNFLDNQLPKEVYRGKGILWFIESERRHVFHLAGKRFSIDDTDWTGKRKNRLVLIGRNLDHETIHTQLKACIAKDLGKDFVK